VLVTGVDGYIGAVLGPRLLERGFDVVGVDCGFYRDGWLYNDTRPRPLTLTKDVRRITPKDVEGFDAVVHLAELSNDPLGELNERTTYEINHLGSVALARACKEAGVSRFVYTSSCSVYGAAEDGGERSEQSAPNPQTAYARCKVLVERDVGALANIRFSPVFLRNATAFGASPRMRFDIVLNNQRDPDDERWNAMAAAGPCRGHLPGGHPRSAGAARGGAQRNLQCRRQRSELPHSRNRRHRRTSF
jgi:nucleoside-diphosphate-sugar epimerase